MNTETAEDALMGVDALDEDPLEPMGSVMRLVAEACVQASSTGGWYPKPIAERILAIQGEARSEARRAALQEVEEAVKGLPHWPNSDDVPFLDAMEREGVLAAIAALRRITTTGDRPAGRGQFVEHLVDEVHGRGDPCDICAALRIPPVSGDEGLREAVGRYASVDPLREAAQAVLTELDIIRSHSDRLGLMVHIDTHNDLRAALTTEAPK